MVACRRTCIIEELNDRLQLRLQVNPVGYAVHGCYAQHRVALL